MDWVVSLVLGVVAVVTLILGILTVIQRFRDPIARSFAVIMLAAAGWSAGIAVFYSTHQSVAIADWSVRIYYIAAALIALAIAYLALAFARKTRRIGKVSLYPLLALPYVAIVIILLVAPSVFLQDIQPGQVTLSLTGYLVYTAYFLLYYSFALGLLAYTMKYVRGVERTRIKYLLIGYTVGGVIGMAFNLILPVFGRYEYIWVGPLGLFIFVPMVYVIIVKYGLFDIRQAAARTMAYISTLAVFAITYSFIATYLSSITDGSMLAQTVLILLAALSFQPAKLFFDHITEAIFYRNTYNAGEFYAAFNKELTSTTDLKLLMQRTSTLVQKTLKTHQAFLVVYTDGSRHIATGTPRHAKLAREDVALLAQQDQAILTADMPEASSVLRRMFVSYRLALVMPLKNNGQILGFLCLGEHLTSRFAARDFRVLTTIADSLAIAIQNALSIHEVKEINDTLQQRIDNATKELRRSNAQLQRLDEIKDEFISMASHQLRTPLTSIKGYLSMLIEGDLGELTKEQKHVLSETFVSSERMVRLIGDFLNVSRLQTGKFVIDKRPVDLSDMIQREIDALAANAAARNIKFVYKKPKHIPILELDENKIEQVVMNFADNAIYYSQEHDTIKVSLEKTKDFVEFTVEDKGIGVPQADQAHLFTKFYRASNARQARPDGTGVGLFLAKKVIDDHGGSIIFKSTEGQGSTFGFRLPIAQKPRR